VTCAQFPTATTWPGPRVTSAPSTCSPVTIPLPAVPETPLAVTAPPNSETEARVTLVLLHVPPLAAKEPNATSGFRVGYDEGPRLEAGVANANG
jgi:hypothetical protein